MILPYTEAQSIAAHHEWKASCGHHCCAAFAGKPLDDVKNSGIKLTGWMNPTMISQCLTGVQSPFEKIVRLSLTPGQILEESTPMARRIFRVQFSGPWMNGPAVGQYKFTHYIALVDGWIMDPLLDCCLLINPKIWLQWAEAAYPKLVPKCTGFHFTHAWDSPKS